MYPILILLLAVLSRLPAWEAATNDVGGGQKYAIRTLVRLPDARDMLYHIVSDPDSDLLFASDLRGHVVHKINMATGELDRRTLKRRSTALLCIHLHVVVVSAVCLSRRSRAAKSSSLCVAHVLGNLTEHKQVCLSGPSAAS
jgi:hypothetical protein